MIVTLYWFMVILGHAGSCWVLLGGAGWCWVKLDDTIYWISSCFIDNNLLRGKPGHRILLLRIRQFCIKKKNRKYAFSIVQTLSINQMILFFGHYSVKTLSPSMQKWCWMRPLCLSIMASILIRAIRPREATISPIYRQKIVSKFHQFLIKMFDWFLHHVLSNLDDEFWTASIDIWFYLSFM